MSDRMTQRLLFDVGSARQTRYTPSPTLRRDFFVNITTDEQAYWLGFLAADGSVSRNVIAVGLALRDMGHVEKFRNALAFDCPIAISPARPYTRPDGKVVRGGASARVTVGSVDMARSLVKYGFHGGPKSHTMTPWAAPTHDLQRAYWRGCFDGDGSVSKGRSSPCGHEWTLAFCGNLAMVEGFRDFCLENTERGSRSKESRKVLRGAGVFTIAFSGSHQPKQIAELLYGGSAVYLDRKMALVREMLSEAGKTRPPTKDALMDAYSRLKNWPAVGVELGVSSDVVWSQCRKHGLPRRDHFTLKRLTLAELESQVAESGSVKAAASHLGVTPIALSCRLTLLRKANGSWNRSLRDWSGYSLESLEADRLKVGSWKAVAEKMDVPVTALRALLQRRRGTK